MTKTEVIEFLTEQRDLRLVGYDDSKPAESDFDRWQLAQAEMFQKVIDWLEGSNVGKLLSLSWLSGTVMFTRMTIRIIVISDSRGRGDNR
ncbi:TPA: hypothetical protein VB864_001824 [Streptococcus suis]|nr:hypothetical protein [Streptococcus suis]NQN69942.1 hypothetical protein [Streptococcus suis]NQN72008.1 hypothetical protein [Streptococcus suis]NQN74136.1 hypothetical protein [Streptococcus suis]NQN79014.1 hypothetical protein [Streptococcus suis]